MKIIIYGANEIGSMLATEFFEDHDIVVIDPFQENLEHFANLDIATIHGDGADLEILRNAEIEDSDIFISCTNDDNKNIVSCVMAKHCSDIQCVCFVSNREVLNSLRELRANTDKNNFFIDHIIWPEKLLTQEIFQIITIPNAIDVENFAHGRARLLEYRISEDSILLNRKIKDCNIPDETLIVGIVKGDELIIPTGNSELELDDKVIFIGTPESLDITAAELYKNKSFVKNITIIGGGSVGYQLAKKLEKTSIKVKIIESDYQRCEFLSENLNHALVLHGNGTDSKLLAMENIEDSDVVVCVTNSDEKDLLCSLLVKQLGAKRIVARVSKSTTAKLFEKIGVDIAVSARKAAVEEVKNRLIETKTKILASVESGLGKIIEVEVGNNYTDKALMDLKLPTNLVIVIIRRHDKVIIPKGQTLIRANDKLVIFTKSQDTNKIKDYFK